MLTLLFFFLSYVGSMEDRNDRNKDGMGNH